MPSPIGCRRATPRSAHNLNGRYSPVQVVRECRVHAFAAFQHLTWMDRRQIGQLQGRILPDPPPDPDRPIGSSGEWPETATFPRPESPPLIFGRGRIYFAPALWCASRRSFRRSRPHNFSVRPHRRAAPSGCTPVADVLFTLGYTNLDTSKVAVNRVQDRHDDASVHGEGECRRAPENLDGARR